MRDRVAVSLAGRLAITSGRGAVKAGCLRQTADVTRVDQLPSGRDSSVQSSCDRHEPGLRAWVLVVAALIATSCVGGTVATSPTANLPSASATAASTSTPTAADIGLVRALADFARAPGAGTLGAVPFADRVKLGLSDQLMTERASVDLLRPDAWVLQADGFRGHVGPFSALDLMGRDVATTISVGPHPHCASPPVPPQSSLVGLRRVSVQPKLIDSCLLWWTVDLFVSAAGRIEAVTLDLWNP